MEKMWRKVGLHTSRRKRERDKEAKAGADKTKGDTIKTEQGTSSRGKEEAKEGDDAGTLRSSYIVRSGEEYVLVERRRRRRRKSVGGSGGGSGGVAPGPKPGSVPLRRPPARLRIFGIEWPLHSNECR